MPHTTFPAPAPESPSTSRRTQCGAASAAVHAPALRSAPDEHGPAALASDQRALALLPPSTVAAVRQHPLLRADHAPPAASLSPPAAALPAARPPLPQTRCAILHAAPTSRPGSS